MRQSIYAVTAALAISVISSPVIAEDKWQPMLDQGTNELSVAGMIKFDPTDYDLILKYGYFVRDGWEVGVDVAGSDSTGVDTFQLGLFTEYNFRRDQWIVPYVGGSLSFLSASFDSNLDFDTPLDDDSFVVGINTGVKWFLRPYMAIRTGLEFQVASDDIWDSGEQSFKDNVTKINIGMSYYF